jgi:hypothetical protein
MAEFSPVIINQPGPLPIKATIPWPSTNTVVVAVSGSAYTNAPNTLLRMDVLIGGEKVGELKHFANPASTHLAFPTAFIAIQGAFGDTTVVLTPSNGNTNTDYNDTFTVALLY